MQQCPSCQYELTMKEQVDNAESCPKCGIYFEKFLAKQAALKEAALSDSGRIGGLAGAKAGIREERELADSRSKPKHVSVVDFDVPFWALVRFMVKFVFATIPAAIIVALLIYGFASIVSVIGIMLS